MFLNVSQALRQPGQEFPFQGEQEIPPQDIYGETVTFEPAVLEGVFSAIDDQVTLEGTLKTIAHAQCANCLAPAQAEVQASFRETFLRNGDPEDAEIYVFEGFNIGLEKLAMSTAMLNLPMRFLCKEDCQGLWREFGVDNEITACQKELQQEHPFAALQQLLTKDEEV